MPSLQEGEQQQQQLSVGVPHHPLNGKHAHGSHAAFDSKLLGGALDCTICETHASVQTCTSYPPHPGIEGLLLSPRPGPAVRCQAPLTAFSHPLHVLLSTKHLLKLLCKALDHVILVLDLSCAGPYTHPQG